MVWLRSSFSIEAPFGWLWLWPGGYVGLMPMQSVSSAEEAIQTAKARRALRTLEMRTQGPLNSHPSPFSLLPCFCLGYGVRWSGGLLFL
jgi:hypothetical protein